MTATPPRVGLFGLLGSGNIGNDASVEAIMGYLRAEHPDAIVDAMCMGWQRMRDWYGMDAIPFQWQQQHDRPGLAGQGLKVLGKVIDIARTAAWVRKHDVVIIPGMGVMDASLPLNPWGVPLLLYTLCWFARRSGTKVAMVSVGASLARNRVTRWLNTRSARLVSYRTFRDVDSREVLRRQGLDTSADKVYPDLVFALPVEHQVTVDPNTVVFGILAYYGSNEDRDQADERYAAYIAAAKSFARWLVDSGRNVRLLIGDEVDQVVSDEILADIREQRPDLEPGRITGGPISTYPELVERLAPAATVVASRFHNVLTSLKLGKPTISIAYGPKNDSLMRDMGQGEHCQQARTLDVELLKKQFAEIERRRGEIVPALETLSAERTRAALAQFDELTKALFGSAPSPGRPQPSRRRVRPSSLPS